jgi:putative membrane protein
MVMSELPGWARAALGSDGAEQIEAAVAEAESHTCGEIVPVLVRRSSTIGHVPVLALCLLLVLILLPDLPGLQAELGGSLPVWLIADFLVAAAAAMGVSRLGAVQRLLTPSLDRIRQVDLRAQVEFYELGLEKTEARTGVLLLVSLMEHRAVVLADRGIAEKLDREIWLEVVQLMVDGVKRRDLASGMSRAVERCGELLAPHFPIAADDANELRDHLVVKD